MYKLGTSAYIGRKLNGIICQKCGRHWHYRLLNNNVSDRVIKVVPVKGSRLVLYCNEYCMMKHNANFHKHEQRARFYEKLAKKRVDINHQQK